MKKLIKGWSIPEYDNHFWLSLEDFPSTNYQQSALDAAFRHVNNYNLAIDIGANIGLHSVRFSKIFKEVVSFEPTTTVHECLIENSRSFSNIKVEKVGLGNFETSVEIMIPNSADNCGVYSIVDFKDKDLPITKEIIPIVKLDNYNLNPDLIKIDVQGFEEEVLKGSITTLEKYSPVLIVEIADKDRSSGIFNLLNSLGYVSIERIKKDYIFVKEKK